MHFDTVILGEDGHASSIIFNHISYNACDTKQIFVKNVFNILLKNFERPIFENIEFGLFAKKKLYSKLSSICLPWLIKCFVSHSQGLDSRRFFERQSFTKLYCISGKLIFLYEIWYHGHAGYHKIFKNNYMTNLW